MQPPSITKRLTSEELRLIARIAKMYYFDELRQPEIAFRLRMSQTRVSRLLKRAQEEGVVRIHVTTPPGVFIELEERLKDEFGLTQAIVIDALSSDDRDIQADLGAAAAYYLETTIRSGDVIGITSWSESLLATVNSTPAVGGLKDVRVVQILGALGDPSLPKHASWIVSRLASLVGGMATYLPSPAIAGSVASAQVLREDPFVHEAMESFADLTVALVDIGTLNRASPNESGAAFADDELDQLRQAGAVGEICLRFFDSVGERIANPLTERVIGIDLDQLATTQRCVAVSGGLEKHRAIEAALRGRLVTVLVTDRYTAEALTRKDSA